MAATMRRLLLLSLCLLPVLAGGCRSSYPSGSVEESIRQLCEKEYHTNVTVATRNKTIGALVVMEEILLSDLSFSDRALKKLEDVMLTTSRVTLSSEFPYEFFVVTILDAKTGVEVSFVRYIKDIRRLITDDISRTDYFQRLLIQARAIPPVLPGQRVAYELQEQKLPDFIAGQIAERLRVQFQTNLIAERLFHVTGLKGEFVPALRSPRDGQFRVCILFDSSAPKFEATGTPVVREDFLKLVYSAARQVIRGYEFTEFSGLAITDNGGRQLAYYQRSEFNRGGMNSLMELIHSIRGKAK